MTLASVLLPERDCATCKNQIEWGCDGPPQIPVLFPSPDEPGEAEQLERCPRRPYHDNPRWYHELFAAWGYVQKGLLPESGSWRDQPAKLPPLLEVIDAALAEGQKEHEKQEKRRQDRAKKAAAQQPGGKRARPHTTR